MQYDKNSSLVCNLMRNTLFEMDKIYNKLSGKELNSPQRERFQNIYKDLDSLYKDILKDEYWPIGFSKKVERHPFK